MPETKQNMNQIHLVRERERGKNTTTDSWMEIKWGREGGRSSEAVPDCNDYKTMGNAM